MKEMQKFPGYYTNQTNPYKSAFLSDYPKKKSFIKPPFKKGLYSYKQSFNYSQDVKDNNFFSYETPNYSLFNIKKGKTTNFNIFPIAQGNSISIPSINLNKYRIPSNNNNNNNENQQINNDSSSGFIKNTNLSMNIVNNLSNSKNNTNNLLNNPQNTLEYYDYFNDCRRYEKESRRMMVEFLKLKLGEKNNKNIGIKQLLKDNKISLKVLNQKLTQKEYDNELNTSNNNTNRKELFGEAKKFVYLKNTEYYLSQNSTITTEIISNNRSKIFNVENMNLNNKNKKRINILHFLLTPRVLNLIEDKDEKQKYVFLISFDEMFYLEGKESYIFLWKNMENNETENEFNIKQIKKCEGNKILKNRFNIKVENEDYEEEISFTIETPSLEICNNYVNGINYLLYK